MRTWSRVVAVVLGCLFLTSSTGYAATIYACKKKVSGNVKILASKKMGCSPSETKISWPDWEEFVALQTQVNNQNGDLTALETRVDDLDTEVTDLQAKVAELAPIVPVAFGFIKADGSISKSTPDLVSTKTSESRYEIIIPGENYSYSNYVTNVTLAQGSSCADDSIVRVTSSVDGKLVVDIHSASGSPTSCDFQFVTFKP
jgi:hypothetical protein